jgi:hypothetical protein
VVTPQHRRIDFAVQRGSKSIRYRVHGSPLRAQFTSIFSLNSTNTSSMSSKKVTEHIETAEEQRELFLWKYRDVAREDVNKMYNVSCASCRFCRLQLLIDYTLHPFHAAIQKA